MREVELEEESVSLWKNKAIELIYCRNGFLNTVVFNRLPARVHPRFCRSLSPLHEHFSDAVFSHNSSALTLAIARMTKIRWIN